MVKRFKRSKVVEMKLVSINHGQWCPYTYKVKLDCGHTEARSSRTRNPKWKTLQCHSCPAVHW